MNAEPLAVSIKEAAELIGISESRLYQDFLRPRRVVPVPFGKRKLIILEELRRAFATYVAETRAGSATDGT
jgi:hypothetical protein